MLWCDSSPLRKKFPLPLRNFKLSRSRPSNCQLSLGCTANLPPNIFVKHLRIRNKSNKNYCTTRKRPRSSGNFRSVKTIFPLVHPIKSISPHHREIITYQCYYLLPKCVEQGGKPSKHRRDELRELSYMKRSHQTWCSFFSGERHNALTYFREKNVLHLKRVCGRCHHN